MKYLLTLLLFCAITGLPAQKNALRKGIAFYEAKEYNDAFKKLTPVMKRLNRMKPEEQAAAVFYYNLVKINIFKRMYRMGQSDKLYNFLLEGYRGLDEVEDYAPNRRWEGDVQLYQTMYYPFVMESAENLLLEAQSGKGLSDAKRLQKYMEAEEFVQLGLRFKESSAAYVLLGQIELGKDDPQKAYAHFDRALSLYQSKGQKYVEFSIGKAIYYRALIEKASNLGGAALQTLRWGQVFLENEHLKYLELNNSRAEVLQVKAESTYLSIQRELAQLEERYRKEAPGQAGQAMEAFEQKIDQNRNDYLQLVAYASLLEEMDDEEALVWYERALSLSEGGILAQKKLGLLLLNKARAITGGRQNPAVSVANKTQPEEVKLLERAYPLLQRAIEADPGSEEVLEALLYITDQLDLRDDYRTYRVMRDRIDR
jgi:hypothetical protein